jgi:Holliday junction resolvase RusA-like endonuclease
MARALATAKAGDGGGDGEGGGWRRQWRWRWRWLAVAGAEAKAWRWRWRWPAGAEAEAKAGAEALAVALAKAMAEAKAMAPEHRTIWIEGRPRPKQRPRVAYAAGRYRAWTPEDTRAEEEAIAWQWRMAYPRELPLITNVCVELVFVGARCDIDNAAKLILDALNGLAYTDDRAVVQLLVHSLPATPLLEPGTLITVRELSTAWAKVRARRLVAMLSG